MTAQPGFLDRYFVGARARGCMTCRYYEGERFGEAIICRQQAKPTCKGDPKIGCAFWSFAVGTDDDLDGPR